MTFEEKLEVLNKIVEKKAEIVETINNDFTQHNGFQKYSAIEYKNAYDAHTDAVNNHGELVSRITKHLIPTSDEYYD